MIVCQQCGKENRDEARFCDSCGATLAPQETSAREERKVVTVLFADLVGFTSRAERMDPEDVRAVLEPYHGHLRTELERYGGTVEKFIGDAVMALFGAPVAHEDDPERAVRAALAIRDWVREQEELQLRIAITTGEALVALGARPAEGEGMASGDVVNTAARLQAAAPVNGILVDETTYRATSPAIDYRPVEAVEAKGKSEPVPAWEATQARSRYGIDTAQLSRAPLIGRTRELDVLVGALARSREERSPQLVTIVGVPGIGKSRLVFELFNHVGADPELITWRQGRSLPYGDGVTFWALSEIVKAQAGILETDTSEATGEKLRQSVKSILDEDAEWVERHLRSLVGLGEDQEPHGDHRTEAFAAWRRYFESLAEKGPLVLVFEDLHWADDVLLDFLDHLVEWASDVPILVVGTARPELLAQRAGWGGGKPNASTVSLAPLSDDQTALLLAALFERSVLPAETQSALLQRAGGNPLYAEEFVRMVADRGLDMGDEDLPLPESVQGIVAARLDALSQDEKALLQDGAVIGKVFWLGAAAGIGNLDRATAEERLHDLERKEFVRRERRTSVAEENQYAFRHVLVRDVAYSQIPRARRAEKHQLAAEWIEGLGRPDDHAEMLAHHYSSALELAGAAGLDTAALSERARLVLREAGDRAFALSAYTTAQGLYERAVELWPPHDPDRPLLLLSYGRVLLLVEQRGIEVLTEARDALLAAGDVKTGAEAETLIGEALWFQGLRDQAFEHARSAAALVDGEPSSYSKAYVVANLSRFLALAGENEDAIRLGREALAMAEELGLEEIRASALNNIGISRLAAGDHDGLDDVEQSLAIAVAINSAESVRSYGNLASMLEDLGDLERASAMVAEGRRLGERFGMREARRWLRAEAARSLYFRGEWDAAAREYDTLIAMFEEDSYWMGPPCRLVRGRMRLARGDTTGAQDDADRALDLARVAKDPQVLWPALAFAARAFSATDPRRAGALAAELLSDWRASGWRRTSESDWPADIAFVLPQLATERQLLEGAAQTRNHTPWFEALVACASGDFRGAANVYAGIGALPDEASARLCAAESLVREGRRAEADAELTLALAFWRSVGATAYVREAEALLAAAG
jgi:class 3 adenylate cyclase/tetratricopeptide (TPR) repeat protein